MASFQPAYDRLLKDEAGYVHHPNDPGQETYQGIARRYQPNWPGWAIVDELRAMGTFPQNLDMNVTLQVQVHDFWFAWWQRLKLGGLKSQLVATKLYSLSATNPMEAVKALQMALGDLGCRVQVDGQMGPQTMNACNSLDAETLEMALSVHMGMFYLALDNQTMIKGWLRRARKFQ